MVSYSSLDLLQEGVLTMQFPITDLLDEQECHDYLLRTLHPNGIVCPQCGLPLPLSQAPHDRSRDPIFDYLCRKCGRVFNLFTDTVWQGTHYDCKTIVLVVRGIVQSTAYLHISATGRSHATACHSQREWARDDDGDGIREVHCNTMEGIWIGLRNFLRLFRGVREDNLALYVVMFEWAHNLKQITPDFMRMLMVPA